MEVLASFAKQMNVLVTKEVVSHSFSLWWRWIFEGKWVQILLCSIVDVLRCLLLLFWWFKFSNFVNVKSSTNYKGIWVQNTSFRNWFFNNRINKSLGRYQHMLNLIIKSCLDLNQLWCGINVLSFFSLLNNELFDLSEYTMWK